MFNWPPEKRINLYLIVLLTLMLSIIAKFILENFISIDTSARPARDFIAFWATSKLTLAGHPDAAYKLENITSIIKTTVGYEELLPWLYPPTHQILITPLALLPYKLAYGIFILISLIAYIYSCNKIAKNNKTIILGAISFPAIYLCGIYGQNSILTASIAILSIYYIKKRPLISGLLVGLLATKPQLALVFPIVLLAGFHWKAILSAIATQATLVIISLYFLGKSTWLAFFKTIEQPKQWMESGQLSWEDMISTFAFSKTLGADTAIAYAIHLSVAALFIFVAIAAWNKSDNINLRGSSLALAALATTPYAQEYELVWLIIPLIFLTQNGIQYGWHKLQKEILIIAWLTPLLKWAMNIPEGQQANPLVIISEIAMLVSIIICAKYPETLKR